MTNAPIRLVVILGVISLAGVIATQVYWANKAIDSQEQQFGHSVQIALRNVVDALCEIDGQDFPSINPIERVSNNYFVVHTNNRIDLNNLEYLLGAELQKRSIDQSFEYGVYDCQSDKMVYGDFVELSGEGSSPTGKLPKLADYDYYFGVYFPEQTPAVLLNTDIWRFATILTVVIIVFFGYAMFIILRQKQLSAIQRDFVNNITHEFKTPLATLKVATGVLADPKASEDTHRRAKYGQIIATESERLEKHVDQLLKSALIENKPPLEIMKLDLAEVTNDILKGFDLKEKGIEVIRAFNQGCCVLADPYLLQVSIYNLIDNAVKYGRSSIQLIVKCEPTYGLLMITDDGIGVPIGERKKIFRKFYRVGNSDTHNVKGFGLGLHVVKKAVERMKGSISLVDKNTFAMKLRKA